MQLSFKMTENTDI